MTDQTVEVLIEIYNDDENGLLGIDRSSINTAIRVLENLSKRKLAEAIYYAENPYFKQYPETSWENYPSEDKGGYFRMAKALAASIIKQVKGE